ncbi:hypothetical protein FJU08_12535 [Martelella alba]|uniref:Uncharacterized protein n=1 Tax=Martelella alba TaxID=2590451 RepID=A0A506U9C7_9HYPH|nr:hypothetical protein [Martelella alba]TPW30138.1 hypothetical protein FJU08_12535 [Martelella alba]
MSKPVLTLSVCLLLVACQAGPINVLYKEGSTRDQRQEAYDQCMIEALKQVPQNMVTEVSGGYSVPGFISCEDKDDKRTYCTEVGGYVTPVTSESHDTNAALRARVVDRCLAEKGYTSIVRPICPSQQERSMAASQIAQPPQAAISCVAGPSVSTL